MAPNNDVTPVVPKWKANSRSWWYGQRKRTTTWKEFIRSHRAVLAGTDFFTVEVLTLRGLVTFYVLFFIHLESRRVEVAGITSHPNEAWMMQVARNVTMDEWGFLDECRYLLHDRDREQQNVPSALVIAFLVIMYQIFPQGPSQRGFTLMSHRPAVESAWAVC